jgi:enamine deaminase RidA (YjgF/YER057c/UK114 family)
VGSRDGVPQIFFLAARSPAQAVENPRQISAYAYPPVYGPRSPRFSRACLYGMEAAPVLLISGTASIVGHESRHPGDPAAQIAETLRNFAALIGAVDGLGFPAAKGNWAFKIFLRDPAHRDLVAAAMNRMFDPKFERLFLHADLCRAELLVEIEAVCVGGRG